MKAVIPAAGFGTRFLPLTKAQPKEMLPVVNKPTIQWVVEEAVDAGITDIAVITGEHKQSIKSHFTPSNNLEGVLLKANKKEELEKIQAVNKLANIELHGVDVIQMPNVYLENAVKAINRFRAVKGERPSIDLKFPDFH